MATEAQVSANRRNAGKSTGPRTTQGKGVVAQNAIKHGLLARRNLIRGEDPQEFELCRRQLLGELEPVGHMETMLAERVVSLSWRLKRAERLQNEVFDYLMAREIEDSLEDFYDDLTPEEEARLRSEPSTDPSVAVGRTVAADYFNAKVLDRLGMYERRIEDSLYRTMKELQNRRLLRKSEPADARTNDESPAQQAPMTDCVKQSQSPAADGGDGPPCNADDLSCETKPISGGQSDETPACGEMEACCAKQSQFPGSVQNQVTPSAGRQVGPQVGL